MAASIGHGAKVGSSGFEGGGKRDLGGEELKRSQEPSAA